jgi:hypothetical protein
MAPHELGDGAIGRDESSGNALKRRIDAFLKWRGAFCGLRRIFHGLVFARYENQTALLAVAQLCFCQPCRVCRDIRHSAD